MGNTSTTNQSNKNCEKLLTQAKENQQQLSKNIEEYKMKLNQVKKELDCPSRIAQATKLCNINCSKNCAHAVKKKYGKIIKENISTIGDNLLPDINKNIQTGGQYNDDYYKQKYIKYKTKYLNYKNKELNV